jgi:polysaccharide chain length determinant protein (PEP-CTERM system associated)
MLGHRVLTIEDYTTLLKKRGWMIAVPAILLLLVGWGITFFVPPQYLSQTLVLIEQQRISEKIVQPIATEDLNSRLASMREQIMSRSRLEPIINQFNLYGNKKLSMDDRITLVQKDIDIKPIVSEIARTGGLPGFFISFKAGDPHTAQQVCAQITSIFVNEDIKLHQEQTQGTTDFLQSQLDDAKRNLDDQEAKQADFQRKYIGSLPTDEATNMSMLTSLNTQLDAATQQLASMQNNRSYAETMLSALTKEQPPVAATAQVQPQAQEIQLQALLTQEADLTAHYTDDYPDVVAVRRRIADLRAQMAKPRAAAPTATNPSANRDEPINIVQLRAQIRGMDMTIAQKVRDQAAIQAQVRTYQGRLASSPMVQEEYKTVTRDYQTSLANYNDLQQKMNSSKMATSLEIRQQGEQFKVMDAANLPESPEYPKKGIFMGGGFGAGMLLGLLIVSWIEYRDTAVRSERDLWAFTKLPTLAVIAFSQESYAEKKRSWFKFGKGKDHIEPTAKPVMN